MMNKLTDISVGTLETPGIQVSGSDAGDKLASVLGTVIGLISAIAFIYFIIQTFLAALAWITAGGDKGKVEQARAKLTSGVQGLVVVIAAFFLIQVAGFIFGIDFLDINAMITALSK